MHTFNKTQNNYDRLSRLYELIDGWGERSICIDAIRLINIQSGEKVLEVGSGTGTNLFLITNIEKNCEIVGLDLSYKMCQQVKITIKRTKVSPADVVNGNVVHFPFPNNHFDVLFMLFTLEIIPNSFISHALSECKRVLKPNGRICVGSMAAEKLNHLMMRLYHWSNHHFPEVVDCRPIDLESNLKCAGFEPSVNQLHSLWGLPVRILLANKSSRSEDEITSFSN